MCISLRRSFGGIDSDWTRVSDMQPTAVLLVYVGECTHKTNKTEDEQHPKLDTHCHLASATIAANPYFHRIRHFQPSTHATMSNTSNANRATDPYRLNRDVLASTRLNLQHYIWKESMGYILHPSVKLPSSSIAIADVGTGTGYCSSSYWNARADYVSAASGHTIYPASTPTQRSTASTFRASSTPRRDLSRRTSLSAISISSRKSQPNTWRDTI